MVGVILFKIFQNVTYKAPLILLGIESLTAIFPADKARELGT